MYRADIGHQYPSPWCGITSYVVQRPLEPIRIKPFPSLNIFGWLQSRRSLFKILFINLRARAKQHHAWQCILHAFRHIRTKWMSRKYPKFRQLILIKNSHLIGRLRIRIPINSKVTVLFLSKRTGILKKQMHEKLFLIGYVNLYNKLV